MVAFQFAEIRFDSQTGDLSTGIGKARLRPKTSELLLRLLLHPGQVLTRGELLDTIWKDRTVTENTLMQSVRELRAALSDNATRPQLIETVHGVGYRWIGPIPQSVEHDIPAQEMVERPPRSNANPTTAYASQCRQILTALTILVLAIGMVLIGRNQPNRPSIADHGRYPVIAAQATSGLDTVRQELEAELLRSPNNVQMRSGLISVLYRQGDWSRALEIGTHESLRTDNVDGPSAAEALLYIGKIRLSRGDSKGAERSLLQAERQLRTGPISHSIYASVLRGLSQAYADQGRIADYLGVRARAVDPIFVEKHQTAFAEGLLSAGTTVRATFDSQWDLERLGRALSTFEELDDALGEARVHAALGQIRAIPDAERERHLRVALHLFRRLEHVPGEMDVWKRLASLETERLNGPAAIDAVLRFQAMAERLGADRELATAKYALGLAHMAMAIGDEGKTRYNHLLRAEAMFRSAAAYYDDLGIVFDAAAPRLHQAIAFLELGKTEVALELFQAVAWRYHELPFPPGELGANLGAAVCLGSLGRSREAKELILNLSGKSPEADLLIAVTRKGPLVTVPKEAAAKSYFEIVITAEKAFHEAGLSP